MLPSALLLPRFLRYAIYFISLVFAIEVIILEGQILIKCQQMLNFKQYNFKGKVFHIDPIVRGYNLAMVAVNFYIAYELYANTIGHYNWACEPVDTTVNPRSMRIASAIYLFWFSKLIELLDSVFFILRGKYNQGLKTISCVLQLVMRLLC